jgi:hypothetical protein
VGFCSFFDVVQLNLNNPSNKPILWINKDFVQYAQNLQQKPASSAKNLFAKIVQLSMQEFAQN